MTGFDKLQYKLHPQLPDKSEFHSRLNNTDISDEDYEQARKVWTAFACKTMCHFHDLYMRTDVLLLTDVMENFRRLCVSNYGLDPLWYYTAPGLAWDATLKISDVFLDLLMDPKMYLMVERGVCGGISTITKRHAVANNKYTETYNDKDKSTYIPYLDANNLYGWAMSKPLPTHRFAWMTLQLA